MSDILVETSSQEAVQTRKESKIPTRIPQSREKKISKASASESANVHPATSSCNSPAKVRARHTSGRERRPGVPASNSKENIPPTQLKTCKKPNLKGNISYMELKRRHEDLVVEVQTLGQQSKKVEDQHHAEVNTLAEEIQHYKESNAALKQEISAYQGMIEARNQDLGALQQHLEDIKFENERLASILEGSRLDALTGEKIKAAIDFQSREHETEFNLEAHEQSLDSFITTLETTITTLKEQKEKLQQPV